MTISSVNIKDANKIRNTFIIERYIERKISFLTLKVNSSAIPTRSVLYFLNKKNKKKMLSLTMNIISNQEKGILYISKDSLNGSLFRSGFICKKYIHI